MKRSCLILLTVCLIGRRYVSTQMVPPSCQTGEGLNTTSALNYRMFQVRWPLNLNEYNRIDTNCSNYVKNNMTLVMSLMIGLYRQTPSVHSRIAHAFLSVFHVGKHCWNFVLWPSGIGHQVLLVINISEEHNVIFLSVKDCIIGGRRNETIETSFSPHPMQKIDYTVFSPKNCTINNK
jgi:hypothetical protein